MSLDGPVIYALESEIRETLVGGRVVRVGQPGDLEIELEISHQGRSNILRLSAHPTLSHICFYPGRRRKVKPGSGFGSTLERVITGSILFDVKQPDFDRILRFTFRKRADLIPFEEYFLVVELLGRYSNLILLDHSGKISASLIPFSKGSRRVVPGVVYQPPPPLRGLNPLQSSLAEIKEGLEEDKRLPIGLALKGRIRGFTDGLVEEILGRIGIEPSDQSLNKEKMGWLLEEVGKIFGDWKSGRITPLVLYSQEGRPDWLSIMEIKGVPPQRRREFGSVNEAICYLFDEKRRWEELSSRKMYLFKVLDKKYRDLQLLLQKLEEDYLSSKNAEDYKIKGDLIISHLKDLRKGMEKAELPNLYDPEGELIEVELDPKHTPQENAQLYYRLYGKVRRSRVHIKRRMVDLNKKLQIIKALRNSLEKSDDLLELKKTEKKLQAMRLIPFPVTDRPEEEPGSKFLKFYTSDGWEVMLGRGGAQNDELTHRVAKPDDIWLHAQGVPGSHVIIKRGGRRDVPSQRALSEAASVAAFFSRARTSKVVPVIYTLKKYVRRPRGAKLGIVVVHREKPLFVEPKKPSLLGLK